MRRLALHERGFAAVHTAHGMVHAARVFAKLPGNASKRATAEHQYKHQRCESRLHDRQPLYEKESIAVKIPGLISVPVNGFEQCTKVSSGDVFSFVGRQECLGSRWQLICVDGSLLYARE
jgi:hypothetical protein